MSEGVESATSARRAEPVQRTEEQNKTNAAEKKEIGDATNRVNGAQLQGAARQVGGRDGTDDFRTATGATTERTEEAQKVENGGVAAPMTQTHGPQTTPQQRQEAEKQLGRVAAGDIVLKRGSEGPAVAEMQRTLNTAMPGSNLTVDGKFDQNTERTVQNYQRQHGLNVDGRIDRRTLDSLRAPNTAQMQADPAFQKMERPTQDAITQRLDAARTDPAQRRNIAALTSSEGFQKMGGEQQRRFLQAQGQDPRNPGLARNLTDVANNANFQNLDRDTQSRVADRLRATATDPVARRNVTDLSTSEGLAKQGPEQQRRMLAAQERAPRDAAFTRDLVGLGNNENFQKLNDRTQGEVTRRMEENRTNPAARRQLSTLAGSEGFGKLTNDQQQQLLAAPGSTAAQIVATPGFAGLNGPEQQRMFNLLNGTNPQVSQPARTAAQNLLTNPAFTSGTPQQQTQMLRDQLTTQPGLSTTVQTNNLTTPQTPYTLSGPTAVPNHPFVSGPAAAQQYQLNIDGRTITVTMPNQTNPGAGTNPTINDVAAGIASLPKSSRDLINSLTVNPGANPSDAYWGKIYNQPGFRSYMTAGAAGDVNVYPSQYPHHQGVFTDSLVHETGHTASQRAFGVDHRGPGWNAWRAAAAADGLVPSTYARSSPQEDFAETLALYQGTRNNPATAAELRRLFPERFRILDGMFGGP